MTTTHEAPEIRRVDFTILIPPFDCTVSFLSSTRELTEQEVAAFEEADLEFDDELPPTCEYMKMPILADGLEALKKAGGSVGALATFCVRYPFDPRVTTAKFHERDPGCSEISHEKHREDEGAWFSDILEILGREETIQEIVREHNGEVAGLRRRSDRQRQSKEHSDLNACTKILCRFPDDATRDRVANEVVQRFQNFNVTVVETTEEDWWE